MSESPSGYANPVEEQMAQSQVVPAGPGSDVRPEDQAVGGEQMDYFGFAATQRFLLPDGKSWIEFSVMNEGQKAKFQKITSKDLVLEKGGNTRLNVDPGTERHALIRAACTDWNLKRGGVPVPFNSVQIGDFLHLTDPKIAEDLEKAIRKANPWLTLDNLTSEEIRKEIAELEETLREVEERERGEGS